MGIKYSDLNLSVNNTVKEVSFKDVKFNVLKYLPHDKKYDMVMITLQNSEENDSYNPIKLDMFFNLYLVYLYTDIDFTSEEKESPDIIYDCIKSSGLLDVIIDNIPEEEYNELFSYLTTMVEEKKELSKTLSGAISKLINELPEKAQNYKKLYGYLMKARGISYETVNFFVKEQKPLYQVWYIVLLTAGYSFLLMLLP